VSIPALSGSGNLWNRMPQARLEIKSPMSGNEFLLQFALVRPLAADNVTAGQGDYIGAGELNKLPFVQGRAAIAFGKSATVGVSGHFGQEDFSRIDPTITDDEKTSTYAVAVDLAAGSSAVKFMGEGFIGQHLNMLFSNAGHRRVLFSETDSLFKNEPMKVMGGWSSITVTPMDSPVSFNVGGGIEILDKDAVEILAETATPLYSNMTVFGNILYTPVPKITFGVEAGYIMTTYKRTVDGEIEDIDGKNTSLNLSSKITF
jgi:hypothetical protein